MTAARSAAAISATAAWFIVSGCGGSPGSTRWIGPRGSSSILPASVSPKCRSLTVPIRHSKLSARARQCTDLVSADVVDRVGLQMRETNDIGRGTHLMGNDQIIGDGGDVHAVEGSGCTADRYRRGRSRRVGNGVTHHRLLNRHVGTRTAAHRFDDDRLGHDTSRAATIAATSSSLARRRDLDFITIHRRERDRASRRQERERRGQPRERAAEPPAQCEQPKRSGGAESRAHS